MRSGIEDKGLCYNLGPTTPEISNCKGNISFEFQKGIVGGSNRTPNHHRTTMGKPTPSKWDDAQKWLSGMTLSRSGAVKSHSKNSKPRNSNADDRRLIASASQREREEEEEEEAKQEDGRDEPVGPGSLEVETKKVDCEESSSIWRINKKSENKSNGYSYGNGNSTGAAIRSVCVRDMGTEMTPIGSQEPSRTTTPIRATTPVTRSPITSPARTLNLGGGGEEYQTTAMAAATENRSQVSTNGNGGNQNGTVNALESRAVAWDEAERAKYMARYKREEMRIQAWENGEKRKAEREMKKIEVKAERMKAQAQEKMANRVAATRRIAEERRANAEAKLNEKAVKTTERADYIRRTGHLPSTFSFKLSSLCW